MPASFGPGLRLVCVVLSVIAGLTGLLVSASAAGSAGYSLELDGSDDEARGGAIAGTAGVQTVEAWVRPARLAYSIFLVNSDDKTGWLMETDDQGHAKFWAADSQGTWTSAPNWRVTVQAGAWQHVAAVYDGARMQTFVNGVGGGWYDLGRMSAGPFLRIGGLRPYPFFAGQLDEVRISSGLRYGGDFTPPSAPFAPDASTLALYHLDEASGQTILDASGRGNHLTRGTTQDAEAADPAWVPSTAPLSGAGGGTDPTGTVPPATATSTVSPTLTATTQPPTQTSSPTATTAPSTSTPTRTATTQLPSATPTATPLATFTPTQAPLATFTPTRTPLATLTPTRTPTQTSAPVDLARARPLSDVSSTASDSSPTLAIDGRADTWWTSGSGGSQWLAVDLDAVTTVRRVNVRWGTARATDWWIETSNDLMTWTRVWPAGAGASGDQDVTLTATGRHIAVVARAGSDPLRYQLASFELYATP